MWVWAGSRRIGIPEKMTGPFFIPIMDLLKLKYQDFKKLNQYTFNYLLDTGKEITFRVKQYQFPHLVGLHKLTDIPLIAMFVDPTNSVVNAKYVISKIKKRTIDWGASASKYIFSLYSR